MPLTVGQKLETIARYAHGIFCAGTVASNKTETSVLNTYIRRNPDCVALLLKSRSNVYRLTHVYYLKNGIEVEATQFGTPDPVATLRAILWGAFLLEHNNIRARLPEKVFIWDESSLTIDDFSPAMASFQAMRSTCLLTTLNRSDLAIENKVVPVTPVSCTSKWVSRSLMEIYLKTRKSEAGTDFEIMVGAKRFQVRRDNLLKDGIWPTREDVCHKDQRHYDGLKQPVDGKTKWERDKMVLELFAKEPEKYAHYQFGIYRESLE